MKPKERMATIQSHIERDLQRQKDRDRNWEDLVDVCLCQLILLMLLDIENPLECVPAPANSISLAFVQIYTPF
jgi:hypothetical protein